MEVPEGLKVVQVDDSGIGSPVGGSAIGAIDMTTGFFKRDFVDVSYFQDGAHGPRDYQDRVVEIVQDLFDDMRITNDAFEVQICSGNIFDGVRKWMNEDGYTWKAIKVVDPLQSLIENTFSDYLVGIGVPEKIRTVEVGRDQFMYLFDWVQNDPEQRVKYCKTNGTKWKNKWVYRLYDKKRSSRR
jgi:hypothetical protein